MKQLRIMLVVVGAAALAVGAWWVLGRRDPADQGGGAGGGARATLADSRTGGEPRGGGEPPARDAAGDRPFAGVRRLAPEERRVLGAQIAAARTRAMQRLRADADADVPDDQTDVVIPLERVQGSLKEALEDSVTILAECYAGRPPGARDAAVLMRLTSDPEFGTVIDTDEITDANGVRLAPELDECLRDNIDSLALPPLAEGGKLDLQYSFRFDDEDADGGAGGRGP